MNITKGTRIRARWLVAHDPPSGLAGAQTKVGCTQIDIVGTCVHIRGDRPEDPTEIRVYIDPEGDLPALVVRPPGCTHADGHVEIRASWIVSSIPSSESIR